VKILFLGHERSFIGDFLQSLHEDKRIDLVRSSTEIIDGDFDFLISHRFRKIIPAQILNKYPEKRRINCHASYLPWNRGAYPLFWSVMDGTQNGVTVHSLSEGLDSGPIFDQYMMLTNPYHSFREAYYLNEGYMLRLFVNLWPSLIKEGAQLKPQDGAGTSHLVSDFERIKHVLPNGWDTKIKDLPLARFI